MCRDRSDGTTRGDLKQLVLIESRHVDVAGAIVEDHVVEEDAGIVDLRPDGRRARTAVRVDRDPKDLPVLDRGIDRVVEHLDAVRENQKRIRRHRRPELRGTAGSEARQMPFPKMSVAYMLPVAESSP